MSQILNRVRDVDFNNSEAVKETLVAFFQNLVKYKEIDCNRWLRALENVINRFPKYCGTHIQTIEQYISHFLSSNNYYNVIEAGKCAHAVQQVRPSQAKTATAKSCWRDQMATLCDAAGKLIDALYPSNNINYNMELTNHQVNQNSPLQVVLSEIDKVSGNSDGPVDKTAFLCTRLKNVLIFIQAMLVEMYPVAKPVQPQLILRMMLKVLSGPASEDSENVTTIKVQALKTLDAIVACLGSNLIPYSALVFRLIMQTFKGSDEATEGTSKIRITAYNSIAKWLDTLHVHSPPVDGHSRPWHDELAAHIVTDVTPAKQVMELTANAQPMKNLSKKARKRLANTMLKESKIASHMPGEKNKNNLSDKINHNVIVAALECAESFLSTCGLFLKTSTLKQFQELLVQESFLMQDHSSERMMCFLRALEACRKSCSVKVPPPTQYCLHLYSSLINSPEREVAKFCSQALLDIRLHLHCSPASLCYSADDQQEKKKKEKEGRKRTSERNRAALEQLLGIDWMKTADPAVVTVPDEPEAKRTRLEDDDDDVSEIIENVSISSDSVHSVEMSSDSDDESIIEGIGIMREPRAHIIEDDDVILEPDNTMSNVSAIHNEPTLPLDEPQTNETIDIVDNNETNEVIKDLAIHDLPTQAVPNINYIQKVTDNAAETNKDDAEVEKIMESPFDSQKDIHEAKTQLLQNSDTVDGKSLSSMEVAYDYPSNGNEKVTVLEKMDDENLPSTNDTDDIQITCGQLVKSSQDLDGVKTKDGEIIEGVQKDEDTPKVNGIDKQIDNANGDAKENGDTTSKTTPSNKEITVEDMLADFVDEIDENTQT